MSILKLKGINKKYKKQIIFKNLNFKIENSGIIIKIKGQDLVSKSAFLQIISTFDYNYEGELLIYDKKLSDYTLEQLKDIHGSMMRVITDEYNLFEKMNVYDNLRYSNYRFSNASIDNTLELFNIVHLKKIKVSKLTKKQKCILAIARSYLSGAKIIILDEPFLELSQKDIDEITKALDILKASESTIIYLSLDDYIPSVVDEEYTIENYKLNQTFKSSAKSVYNLETSAYTYGRKQSNKLMFCIKNYNFNFISEILKAMLFGLVISLLIAIVAMNLNDINTVIDKNFFGLDDNYILMSTQKYDESTNTLDFYLDDKIYFNEEDINKINDIGNIGQVILFNYGISSFKDYNNNQLVDDRYYFYNLPVPYQAIDIINPTLTSFDVDIIYGDYPQDKSNEILVPKTFVSEVLNSDDYQSQVNKTITLKVSKDNKEFNYDYVISGIYEADKSDIIYTPYNDRMGVLSENLYNYIIDSSDSNMFKDSVVSDYETMKEAWGIGISHILIETFDVETPKVVANKLMSEFDDVEIISNYQKREGHFKQMYDDVLYKTILITYMIALIFSLSAVILMKRYRYKKTNLFMVSYLNGHSYIRNQYVILYNYFINVVLTVICSLIIYYILIKSDIIKIYLNINSQTMILITSYALIINLALSLKLAFKNKKRVFRKML